MIVLYGCLGIAAFALAVVVAYWLRWVLLGVGMVGLAATVLLGVGTGIDSARRGVEPPTWVAYVALGSLACVCVGMFFAMDELDG